MVVVIVDFMVGGGGWLLWLLVVVTDFQWLGGGRCWIKLSMSLGGG